MCIRDRYLDGVNFPALKVAGYNGSWSELADVSLASTVAFERKGQTVRPRTTSAGVTGVYIAEDQLRGAHFYFPSSGDVRRIAGNSAGYWANGAVDEQRAILFLEGCDGGEDAAGDAGQIWHRRALVIIAPASEAVDYSRLRVCLLYTSPSPRDRG